MILKSRIFNVKSQLLKLILLVNSNTKELFFTRSSIEWTPSLKNENPLSNLTRKNPWIQVIGLPWIKKRKLKYNWKIHSAISKFFILWLTKKISNNFPIQYKLRSFHRIEVDLQLICFLFCSFKWNLLILVRLTIFYISLKSNFAFQWYIKIG